MAKKSRFNIERATKLMKFLGCVIDVIADLFDLFK